eukprot:7890225-Pyramimonas_sp.AAC.1
MHLSHQRRGHLLQHVATVSGSRIVEVPGMVFWHDLVFPGRNAVTLVRWFAVLRSLNCVQAR